MSSSVDPLRRGRGTPAPPPSARRSGAPRPAAPTGVTWLRLTVWLLVGGVVLLPLASLVWLASSGNHLPMLLDGDVVQAARNSLVSAGLSAVGAVLLGTVLAVLLDDSDLPGRRVLRLFLLSPLLIPPFVGAISWLALFGPSSTVNRLWTELTGQKLWNIYGGDGVVFLLVVHSYPIAYLIISAALRRLPNDLEQAARISGASARRAMGSITLPLLRPVLLSALTLTFVSNLSDFGIPSIIGLPERYVTLSTLVYRYVQSGTVQAPLEVVATIGMVLLAVAVAASLLDRVMARRGTELDSVSIDREPLRLGRARTPVAVVSWVAGLALTVLPVAALTTQALLPAPGVPLRWENLTLDNLVRAVTAPGTVTGVVNSAVLSLGAAAICVVLGLALGVLTTRTVARGNGALTAVALLPQAIPGLVIGVGWLVIAPSLGLFNTRWLILCAYVMSFLALVVQAVRAPLAGTPSALEEAARISGARPLRSLLDVSWRLGFPAALTGGVLVALTAVRELTVSVLLVAPGTQTLGVSIFNLQQAGAYNAASALSLLVTVVGLSGLGLAAKHAG